MSLSLLRSSFSVYEVRASVSNTRREGEYLETLLLGLVSTTDFTRLRNFIRHRDANTFPLTINDIEVINALSLSISISEARLRHRNDLISRMIKF